MNDGNMFNLHDILDSDGDGDRDLAGVTEVAINA